MSTLAGSRSLSSRTMKPLSMIAVITASWVLLASASAYAQSLAVLVGIYFLLAHSLNIVIGYTDLISFGHAAFFAVGAYGASLAAVHWHTGLVVGALFGAALAALLAILVGLASVRLSGVYFALATLAAAEIVRIILLNWIPLTRGPLGLSIPLAEKTLIPGLPLTQGVFIHLVFGVAIVVVMGTWVLLRSDLGQRMIAVRENAKLAASIGVSPTKYRLIAFAVSGAVAAVAGSLFAFNYGIVTPTLSGLHYSSIALLMVIFGGRGTLLGPFIGAAVFVLLPDLIDVNGALGEVLFAVVLLAVVLLMPQGVIGTVRGFLRDRRQSSVRSGSVAQYAIKESSK